jgi:branched-subunit amino acid aminotransferase/4-amino-4-deoxychorismate lyase
VSARWVWLSGRFLHEAEASIPATSRSVRLGVGVYDTFRVRGGRAPLLARHLQRIERSARELDLWPGPQDWEGVLAELARRNALDDGVARLTLGDGFALLGLAPLPEELDTQRRRGIELPVLRLERPLADVKGTSRLDLEHAERRAGGEVLLLSASGSALETTRANFFAVTGTGLETAPVPDVLPGIARALLLEIALELGIGVSQRAPRLADLGTWREAFASNAPRGVRPVTAIAGAAIGDGKPGPLSLELQRRLDERSGLGA